MKYKSKYLFLIVSICSYFQTIAQNKTTKILFDTVDIYGVRYSFKEVKEYKEYLIFVTAKNDSTKVLYSEKVDYINKKNNVEELFVDINFDGHLDIQSGDKLSQNIYFFQPKSNKFEFQEFISTLSEEFRDVGMKSVVYSYNSFHPSYNNDKNLVYFIFSGVGLTDGIEIKHELNIKKIRYETKISSINLKNVKKRSVKKSNQAKKYFDQISTLPSEKKFIWEDYSLFVRTASKNAFEILNGDYSVEFILKKNEIDNDSLTLKTDFNIFKMSEKDRTFLNFEDFNFDGFPDLRFHDKYTSKHYKVYLFSNKNQAFEFSNVFSNYTSFEIDKNKQRLIGVSRFYDLSHIPFKLHVDTFDFKIHNFNSKDKNALNWKNFQLRYSRQKRENENTILVQLFNDPIKKNALASIELPYSLLYDPSIQFLDYDFDGYPDFSIKRNQKSEYYFLIEDKSKFELKPFLSYFDTVIVYPQYKTLLCKNNDFNNTKYIAYQNKNLDFGMTFEQKDYQKPSNYQYFSISNDSLFPLNEKGFNKFGDKYYVINERTRIEMTFEKVYNSYPGKDIPFTIPINIPFTCKLIESKTNQSVFKMNYYNTTHLSKMTYDSLMKSQVKLFEKDVEVILIDQNKEDLYSAPYYFELESPYFLNNKIDKPTYNDFKVYSKETDSVIFTSRVRLDNGYRGGYSGIKVADFNFDSYPDFYIETDDWEKRGYYFYDENTATFYRDSLLNLSVLNNVTIHFDEKKISISTNEEVGKKQYRFLLSGKDLQNVQLRTYNVLSINVTTFEKEENFYYDGKSLKEDKLNPNYIDPRYNIIEEIGR